MDFTSIDDVLDFAIRKEEEAADLYSRLAEAIERPGMREAFRELAAEEERHRERLLRVKAGELPKVTAEVIQDLGITEILVATKPSPNMTYAEALVYAMQAEKAAFRLYSGLAAQTQDPAVAAVFRGLAQEEARHKLKLEIEYDDHVLEGV